MWVLSSWDSSSVHKLSSREGTLPTSSENYSLPSTCSLNTFYAVNRLWLTALRKRKPSHHYTKLENTRIFSLFSSYMENMYLLEKTNAYTCADWISSLLALVPPVISSFIHTSFKLSSNGLFLTYNLCSTIYLKNKKPSVDSHILFSYSSS